MRGGRKFSLEHIPGRPGRPDAGGRAVSGIPYILGDRPGGGGRDFEIVIAFPIHQRKNEKTSFPGDGS